MWYYFISIVLILAVPWPSFADIMTAHVSWNYPTEREAEISGFELYLDGELVKTSPAWARSEDLEVTADQDGDRCFAFTMRAYNEENTSEFTREVFACVNPVPVASPDMLVSLDQSGGGLQIQLFDIPAWNHVQIFLDTDDDPETGYSSSSLGIFGADYLIEDAMLYTMQGISSDRFADWQPVGAVVRLESAANGTVARVALEYLGEIKSVVRAVSVLSDAAWDRVAAVPASFMSAFDIEERSGDIPAYLLPDNQWRMISLPADPGSSNTVQAVFEDDIGGQYGIDWVVYQYDAREKRYIQLGPSSLVGPGIGLWIFQATGREVTLRMPAESQVLASTFQVELSTPESGESVRWNLAGYPVVSVRSRASLGITTGSGDCSGDACTLEESSAGNIFFHELWHFDGIRYESLKSYDLLRGWDAFWCAVLSGARETGSVALTTARGMETRKDQYEPFEPVTLELQGADGEENSWIGIYPLAASSSSVNNAVWSMTGGKVDGLISLAGLPSGDYEARLFSGETTQPEAVDIFSVVR